MTAFLGSMNNPADWCIPYLVWSEHVWSGGMSDEEAIEYLEYNTFCAYVGPLTPIFCRDEF